MVSSILSKNKEKIPILSMFSLGNSQDSDFLFVFRENWGHHNLLSRLSEVWLLHGLWSLAHLLSSFWRKFLKESFCQKLYFVFLEILNKNKEACTVVGLSTRPTPLIISKFLQFRTFWSQSKALFMIRCMLSVGIGFKTFGALKVTILCQMFWTSST